MDFGFSRTGKLLQMQYRHIALFAEGEMVAQATFTSSFAYFMKAAITAIYREGPILFADELHTSIASPRLDLVVWRPCNLRQVAATKPFRTWSLGMHHVRGSLDLHLHCTLTLSEGCKFARHTRIDLSSHISAIWKSRFSISS